MKDVKTINKSITSIKTRGAKLDALIQSTALDVLEHFQAHRDTGMVNRLYLALPKGARGTALAQWLLRFVAVKVNTNAATKKEQPFVFDSSKVAAMMAEDTLTRAAAVSWYDLKPTPPLDEVFDVRTAVRSMLRKIETSTKVEHFDHAALAALATAVGIPESDVPTKPGLKAKNAVTAEADVLATAEPATL